MAAKYWLAGNPNAEITNAEVTALGEMNATELDLLDGASAGSVVASKAAIYGSDSLLSATGLQIGSAAISGLTASLQTTGTIAIADDSVQVGKYCTVSADAQTLTLPAVVIGASFIIVNIAADGGALLTISPNSSDKFLVDIAGAAGTDDKDILNTKTTQSQYDYVHLIGAHADGWLIHDIRGTWVDEA